MEEKKTTLGLRNETLYNFNCAKVENQFRSADDFLLFLLDFYSQNNQELPLKSAEKLKIYKPLLAKKITKNNN